jgi:transcriptional regulator with XRE-family HTH domain
MSREDSPQTLLGSIIRKQRELAAMPMRQFAAAVGISNPYLSQIERGLRAPSEAVLSAIADSLQTSAEDLYSEAGFIGPDVKADSETTTLESAIEAATELTAAQRRALAEIYRGFIDANAVRRVRKPGA